MVKLSTVVWSGRTNHCACVEGSGSLCWLSKRVSHLVASTSCHVKRKKKKKTPNGFLRFLTLPQECRSRNEDVPHVTRGASSAAAQSLKGSSPLWDKMKSNVDSWWLKLPRERWSCSFLRYRGCDVGTADFFFFCVLFFVYKLQWMRKKKKKQQPRNPQGFLGVTREKQLRVQLKHLCSSC